MTAYEMEHRRAALDDLERATRRALVGACSSRSDRGRLTSAVPEETPETPRTLLITLTGKDRPGVTSLVFDTLAHFGVEVSTSSRSSCDAG